MSIYATLDELAAAKAEALGVSPSEVTVRGYTEVAGAAVPTEQVVASSIGMTTTPQGKIPAELSSLMESAGGLKEVVGGMTNGTQELAYGTPTATLMGLLPEGIASIAGIAALGYGIYQALGGGEGEGLFGLDILGGGNGGTESLSPTGGLPVPIGGPGLAEPGKPYLIKEWHVTYPKGKAQYYLVQRATLSGKRQRFIMMYKTWDGTWDWWRLPKPHLAVIGKNMPSHKMLTRLRRNLSRHTGDAKTILKVTQPRALRQATRRYYRRKR